MDVHELAELVRKMRAQQKHYFLSRSVEVLREARKLEGEVDRAVARVLDKQPKLFEEGR